MGPNGMLRPMRGMQLRVAAAGAVAVAGGVALVHHSRQGGAQQRRAGPAFLLPRGVSEVICGAVGEIVQVCARTAQGGGRHSMRCGSPQRRVATSCAGVREALMPTGHGGPPRRMTIHAPSCRLRCTHLTVRLASF